MVEHICEGPVDDTFLSFLKQLELTFQYASLTEIPVPKENPEKLDNPFAEDVEMEEEGKVVEEEEIITVNVSPSETRAAKVYNFICLFSINIL